ncbi:hypothetical protein BH11PSE3_BH11PSE3_06400 [soil metagenome]
MPLAAGLSQYVRAFGARWAAIMSGSLSVPFALASQFLDQWQGAITGALTASCLIVASYFIWKAEREKVIALEAEIEKLNDERDAIAPPVQTQFSQPEFGQWRLTLTNLSDRQIKNCQVLLRALTEISTGRVMQLGEAFSEVSDGRAQFTIPRRGSATVVIMGLTAPRPGEQRYLKIGGDRAREIPEIAGAPSDVPVRLDIQIQATDLNPQTLQLEYDGDAHAI